MSGYSGTPLAKKLGIRAGARLFLHAPPGNYRELLAPMPPGVETASRMDASTDIAHLFATRRAELRSVLASVRRAMRDDAVVWVSWPKKSSGVESDISEDTVRELALPSGLVDIKVCAVDEIWSGLKLMIRRTARGARPAKPARRARP
jgi:Protein of unknown function (DUF3052)